VIRRRYKMENNIRGIVIPRLEMIEEELVRAGRKLLSKAVFLKQDDLAIKNIQKALAEVLKAQKHLREAKDENN